MSRPALAAAPSTERSIPAQPSARLPLAVLVLALMPFPLVLHGWGNPRLAYDYLTIIFPVDLAFAALLVVSAKPLAQKVVERRLGVAPALLAAAAALMTLSWAVHPSVRGAHAVFELWATVAFADTVTDELRGPFSSLLIGAAGVLAVIESVWAAAQLIAGGSLGLTSLGEDAHPLLKFSKSVAAPQGSMVHPYVLAGLGLVAGGALAWKGLSAERPAPWLAGAALAIIPVGYTFSRAGLLGAGLLIGGFAVHAAPGASRRLAAAAGLALAAGVAVPAAIWHGGWLNRAQQTTSATSAGALTTDRGTLVHQAASLIRAHPLTGVGTGRYVPALSRTTVAAGETVLKPVHNVHLLVGAEGGVLALVVCVALFAVVGWKALRAGAAPAAMFLAYLPFILLDHFPYSFPQGLVITGLWLGTLEAASGTVARSRD